MATCPACGTEPGSGATECPNCHLSVTLFQPVREAASTGSDVDPRYVRAIADILGTIEQESTAARSLAAEVTSGADPRSTARAEASTPRASPRMPAAVSPMTVFPPLPATRPSAELKQRVLDYLHLGRRLGVDVSDFEARANAALLTDDWSSLEVLTRDLFVPIASAEVEAYDALLARRNELHRLGASPMPDVELEALRYAVTTGDLGGAQRRATHVGEMLDLLEEEWATVRILSAEADILVETARELGADPSPAIGPLEQARKLLQQDPRKSAERLLARASIALWSLVEAPLQKDLERLRDGMLKQRTEGADVTEGVEQLRLLVTELRKRNFIGAISAYRRLRALVDGPGSLPKASRLQAADAAGDPLAHP